MLTVGARDSSGSQAQGPQYCVITCRLLGYISRKLDGLSPGPLVGVQVSLHE